MANIQNPLGLPQINNPIPQSSSGLPNTYNQAGNFFGGLWGGIKNFFTPKSNINFTSPTNPVINNPATGLSQLGQGYKPLTFGGLGSFGNYNVTSPVATPPITPPHINPVNPVAINPTPKIQSATVSIAPISQLPTPSYTPNTSVLTGSLSGGGGSFGQDSIPGAPTVAPFYTDLSKTNNTFPESYYTDNTTYSDVMNARNQAQDAFLKNYTDYLTKKANYDNLVAMDQAQAQNAGLSGETTDYGQGVQGLMERNNAIKELAASAGVNTASVPVTATQNMLDFANQNLTNYYNQESNLRANAPQFSGQTVNQSTGDIYGFVRDPITGAVSTQVLGNVYNGSYGGNSNGMASGYGQSMGAGNNIPQIVAPYTAQNTSGQTYVNVDRIPSNQADAIKIQAAQAGIPVLTTEEVAKVRAIDQTTENLDNIDNTIQKILAPGIGGRTVRAASNKLAEIFQTNTDVSSFDSYRTAAINAIQALGGGSGSGFRLNQSEIDTAQKNLPTITDNLETAQAKLDKLRTYVQNWNNEIFQGQSSNPGTQTSQSSSSLFNF